MKEMLDLLRDRRAVFFAFVLPLVLYPLVFWGLTALAGSHRRDLEGRDLRVGASGNADDFRRDVETSDHLEVVVADFREEAVRSGEFAAFVEFEFDPGESLGGLPTTRARVNFLTSSAESVEARRRVIEVLDRMQRHALEARFAARGRAVSIDDLIETRALDVSTPVERSAAGLGRMLPFFLVLLLLTGGSFAAIDLVAGEKERGTLETLCVQAVSTSHIVAGKFLAVFLTSVASVALSVAGLLAALSMGLVPRTLVGEDGFVLPFGSLFVVALLILPLAVLSSAVLLGLSAFSRSYREAQYYLMPVTLLSMVPVVLALSPDVTLSGVATVVPVGNVAVAIREALSGRLDVLPLLVVLATTSLYAFLALRKAASLLGSEDVLLGLEPPPLASDVSVEARDRRGLAFGVVMLFVVYFAGSLLQSGSLFSFPVGIALTLWVVVLVPALGYLLFFRRPLDEVFAFGRTRGFDVLLCVPMAAATALVIASYMEFQDTFMPFPQGLVKEFTKLFQMDDLGWFVSFLLFAASPGITEEVLWRGAFQADLDSRRRPFRTIVLVGIFFGAFHLSIHRFAPTAFTGMILAAIRLRTGSIVPCMVFHTCFNATALFGLPLLLEDAENSTPLLDRHLLLVAAVVLIIFGIRRLGDRRNGTGRDG